MMSLSFTLYLFVAIFAVIGMTRGTTKEMLVTMSLVVSMLLIAFLEKYIPPVMALAPDGKELFFVRVGSIIVLAVIGYQTVRLSPLQIKTDRKHAFDAVAGAALGALNGFLIIGCIWYFMAQANYPFPQFVLPPVPGTEMGDSTLSLMKWLPPAYSFYSIPWLTAASIICFVVILWLIL